jgi:uncharacterized repeat protein (TIGR03809 family)
MTQRVDVAGGRDIAARWCAFAEQRLEYLTELFETGRWRRYHSERAFLENVQEAKAAVETWRDLATREASLHNFTAEASRFARAETVPQPDTLRDKVYWLQPQPANVPAESLPLDVSMSAETDRICSDEAPSAPYAQDLEVQVLEAQDLEALDGTSEEMALDPDAIEERYPLLRNAL